GAAKTSTGRLLRGLVDPYKGGLRSEPREARDLMIAANNGWLVAYDNLSYLPQWLSDALCRLATGGGFGTRTLYTDEDETIFDATRPSLVTSISDVITAGDLLDRSVFLALEEIDAKDRKTDRELAAAYERVRPRVLAGLLDAVSGGLRLLPTVRPETLPRMADFGLFAEAVGRGLGWEDGAFLNA